MPSLSRTVLVIGTLAASVAIAQAGDKAAFNAPVRDAMPDITPIIVKAPDTPAVVAAAVAQPVETKPSKGKHPNRLARAGASTKREASNQHDAVARTEPAAPANAVKVAAEPPVPSSGKPEAASSVDQVAKLEAKNAGVGPAGMSRPNDPSPAVPSQASAVTPPAATSNTEAATETPGPPPSAKPDGPREHGSDTVADLVAKHALANGVPVKLAQAVVRIESRGNARASNAGALGLMQIKFGTARAVGFSGPAVGLFVADTNLHFGMKILGDAYRAARGDTCGALMRYQSGHYATRMSHANSVYCSRARAIMAGA